MKKESWTWIERAVWALGIIITVLVSYKSNAKKDAIIETQLNILIESDGKQETYIERQNEINGKFLILYDYFISGSTGTGEEN